MADTQSFALAIQPVLEQAKVTAGTSGLSWNAYGLLYEKLKSAAILAAFDLALEGYQKKQLVLDLLGQFIDNYLPLPAWLFFLKPTIKKWFFWAADGAIESTFKLITKLQPTPAPLSPVVVPVPAPIPAPQS